MVRPVEIIKTIMDCDPAESATTADLEQLLESRTRITTGGVLQ